MENGSAPAPVNNYQNVQDGIWPNGPVQLARGRQAKDPNAKTITFSVSSLEDFETSLREYLREPREQPEHTDCQLSFWIGASFLVSAPSQPATHNSQHQPPSQQPSQPSQPSQPHALQPRPHPHPHPNPHPHPQAPPGYVPARGLHPQYGAPHPYQSVSDPAIALTLPSYAPAANGTGSNGGGARNDKDGENKISLSILEALAPTGDPKEKMRRQRAIAKCCVDSIQKCDGYRYSFHNCWNSREDDSFRFSYYCNDSLLNKDRAANGKGAKLGKRATKPVYDCRGVLSVKFSAIKQTLDVFYKHIPIHKTYEERAPPPRKDSKRRKHLEETDPEALIRIANRPKPPNPPAGGSTDPNAPPKPKKKKVKRDEPHKQTAQNSIESELRAQSMRSLLELIRPDPAPEPPSEPPSQPALNRPVEEEQPPQQPPVQTQAHGPQPRRRPRNSCDVCKAKKTKCDGTRPVCNTCSEKKRQCIFSEPPPDERRPSGSNAPQPVVQTEFIRQAQAASNELTELEKMKRELEEAKARIQQLEAEKTRTSTTPSQLPKAPQVPPQPQPQPQQQPQPQSIQTPQYGHFRNHQSHPSYGTNRPMQSPSTPLQPQPTPPMHGAGTGLTPTQDTSNPYSREFNWPNSFYGYPQPPPSMHQAPQQHQQDQWSPRGSGVFR
ncbi:hypothetical protein BCR34DRAFT_595331 [Clohesyomyces aquaticus]|uniref:Zn(2)-C6 fungal-type domain-containing protein n=1 Tax=Clohesyomyces aquaticus TaxID=1231657 RepID=A0A1Y2ABJ0_9PLEO|nr:hypothetical protein BCR34DRAFT_595331 [Clohesyomyces aquaticus]